MTTKITYEQSYDRLEKIVEDLGNEDTSIDDVSSLVKEGAGLIKECLSQLKNTEDDVKSVLEELEKETGLKAEAITKENEDEEDDEGNEEEESPF
jgi:exodeoxyribonuclease VII small subunit